MELSSVLDADALQVCNCRSVFKMEKQLKHAIILDALKRSDKRMAPGGRNQFVKYLNLSIEYLLRSIIMEGNCEPEALFLVCVLCEPSQPHPRSPRF